MEYYFSNFVHDFMLRAEINFVSNWMDDVGLLRTILGYFEGEEYFLHILLITHILLSCMETDSNKLQLCLCSFHKQKIKNKKGCFAFSA